MTRASKVARLIDEYELDGLGGELEARWTGTGTERMSLRELAKYFNTRLLEAQLLDGGMSALDQDIEVTYRNLTDDEVSAGVRTDTRSRLAQRGIDVDALVQRFVTYQAIRSYLKRDRGVEHETTSDAEKIRRDRDSIQRLLTRTQSVTESRIANLQATGRIPEREFEVLFDLQVLCQECGTQYPVDDFLDSRGCDCQ